MKDHMVNQEDIELDEKIFLKNIVTKIPKLWQSKNENFKNMYMGAGIFLVIFCPCVLYYLALCNASDKLNLIARFVFAYFASLTLSTSVVMLIWGFYVNNSCKKLKYVKWLFITVVFIITLLEFLFWFPALCIIKSIEKIIDRRAETIENFTKCFLVLIFITFILAFLLTPNLFLSIWIVKKIGILCAKINVSRCILFLIITLCVVESFLLCFILLWVMKLRQDRKKKPKIEICNDNLEKDIEYQENKSVKFIEEKIDSEEKNRDITSKRSIEYVWNTIKRIWLFVLVSVFAAITFNFLSFDGIVGDDINAVLTIYTLILLYLDKIKQWK